MILILILTALASAYDCNTQSRKKQCLDIDGEDIKPDVEWTVDYNDEWKLSRSNNFHFVFIYICFY